MRRACRRLALTDALVRARALVLVPWLRGERFTCPFCGESFRRMLPFGRRPVTGVRVIGAGRRANARCPRCNSLDRERLVYLFLRDRTDVLAPGPRLRLLHVAPEPSLGRVLAAHARIDYLSADLRSPLAMERMDLTAIHHPDGAFDVIVCCHVLQSVGDDRAAMRELFRVLRPGGHAVLQVAIAPDRAETLERPIPGTGVSAWVWDQARLYGRDYVDRLAEAGFVVDARRCTDEFDEARVRRFALIPEETVFWCGRPAG
jgi:SAM-dependent methyltransferase